MSAKFGKVIDIILCNNVIVLYLEIYISEHFHCHYNAFIIKNSHTFMAVTLDDISHCNYCPLQVNQSFNSLDKSMYFLLTLLLLSF